MYWQFLLSVITYEVPEGLPHQLLAKELKLPEVTAPQVAKNEKSICQCDGLTVNISLDVCSSGHQ